MLKKSHTLQDRDDNSQIHDLSSHPSAMRQAVLKAYHVLRTVEDHDKSFKLSNHYVLMYNTQYSKDVLS